MLFDILKHISVKGVPIKRLYQNGKKKINFFVILMIVAFKVDFSHIILIFFNLRII